MKIGAGTSHRHECQRSGGSALIEDFKKFINQGSVLDLAVGLVIGAAFAVVINAFVDGLLSPLIGLILPNTGSLGAASFSIGKSDFMYGAVILAVINFVAVADVEPTNEEKMVALLEEIARQPR